jgi:hypothetical protein
MKIANIGKPAAAVRLCRWPGLGAGLAGRADMNIIRFRGQEKELCRANCNKVIDTENFRQRASRICEICQTRRGDVETLGPDRQKRGGLGRILQERSV